MRSTTGPFRGDPSPVLEIWDRMGCVREALEAAVPMRSQILYADGAAEPAARAAPTRPRRRGFPCTGTRGARSPARTP
ncbi:hypothetical protein [Streptomyces sp. NPDC048623]|uniref:hypothetical protein n=1 Tax=Streptomyces sp. NPDC048623 TaxID=3155761 RepID=UPI00341E92F4